MINLFDYQQSASAQIAERFVEFMGNRPMRGTMADPHPLPFYQALASITASGKTVILADTVARIDSTMAVKPVILWLSKGRVVVQQTYTNLQDGGKYRDFLRDLDIRLLSEYDSQHIANTERGTIHFATVGTFNQKDRENGERLIFQSDLDNTEQSTWEALKSRETKERVRRPLIIVYDEAHNLSDQQMDLLLELEPDALLLASATMRLPVNLAKLVKQLDESGWDEKLITTQVSAKSVAESGLIKSELLLAGYAAPMEKAIDDMFESMLHAEKAARNSNVNIKPKAIYVSKTNVVEGNALKRDDPKRPFSQREAPPILIWRYLVEEKNVDPSTIAVYCSLDFDRLYPHPTDFMLFKGGDKDYERFSQGSFKHIIFNQSLQEGWDDPECYFAYIDKSMGSSVQVEQVIGRLLRQPGAKHYADETLNSAHIYVRVDAKNIFQEIVDQVRTRISRDLPEVTLTAYDSNSKTAPIELEPKKYVNIPQVYIDASNALPAIQEIVDNMIDYRFDSGANTRGEGARALVQQRVGGSGEAKWKWVPYENSNNVSARWLFQLAVLKRYPKALQVTPSDDEKFDAKLQIGSKAHRYLETLAENVVSTYLDRVVLRQNLHNPFIVGSIYSDESRMIPFDNSLHSAYSGLNKLELPFAEAIDATGVEWIRNASKSGFGIPLLTIGSSKTFYPDFVIWKGDDVFALDTTGEHLLIEKTGVKLLNIMPSDKSKQKLHIRLIAVGKWNEDVKQVSKDGFSVWSLKNDGSLRSIHCRDMDEAIQESLKKVD